MLHPVRFSVGALRVHSPVKPGPAQDIQLPASAADRQGRRAFSMAAKLSQGELCAQAAAALRSSTAVTGLIDIGANLADKAFAQVLALCRSQAGCWLQGLVGQQLAILCKLQLVASTLGAAVSWLSMRHPESRWGLAGSSRRPAACS